MKNKVYFIALALSMVFISGCKDKDPEPEIIKMDLPTETTQISTTCNASGDTVLVPEGTQCTYSIDVINGGEPQVYSCSNGKVSSNGLTATSLTFNGTTIICE